MSVSLCYVLLLFSILIETMVTCSTVPSLLGYRELFYPAKASCYKSYMLFKPSGQKNSSYTLLMYKKKIPADDVQTITDCSLTSCGHGLCLLDQLALNLNQNDKYHFRLIEKTSDNRYKRPKFFHAVTIERETNDFVYLTWIELIPTADCYYEFNYSLRDYVYLRNNIENSFENTKVNTKILSNNIPEFWRWSRCVTTVKQSSNKITDNYQVFYELYHRYYSNNAKLVDLQDLIPETRCHKINNMQIVMEWQSAVNNTNSVEMLQIPYTHYKISLRMQDNGTMQVFLPLNTSYYIIDNDCSSSASLFLDVCLRTACTQQRIGCQACGKESNGRDPTEEKSTNPSVEISFNYLWFVILAIIGVVIIGLVAFFERTKRHEKRDMPVESRVRADTPVKPRDPNPSPSEVRRSIQQRSLPPVPKPHYYDKIDINVQHGAALP